MKNQNAVILAATLGVSVQSACGVALSFNTESDCMAKSSNHIQLSTPLTAEDSRVLLLGQKIRAIQQTLDNPERMDNLDVIIELGTDQRYYKLVRGWLGYQLQADRSILQARQGRVTEKIQQRIKLVEEAIRRIDLE